MERPIADAVEIEVPAPLEVDAPKGELPALAGWIYVIRAIDTEGWKFPWWGVHLEGVRHLYLDGVREWAFHPERFRPVTERTTGIAVFKKLVEPVLCGTEGTSFLISANASVDPTAGGRTTG